jgi:hypothetical protein
VSKNSENIIREFKIITVKVPDWKDQLGEALYRKNKINNLRDAKRLIGRLERFALTNMRSVPDAVEMELLKSFVKKING